MCTPAKMKSSPTLDYPGYVEGNSKSRQPESEVIEKKKKKDNQITYTK